MDRLFLHPLDKAVTKLTMLMRAVFQWERQQQWEDLSSPIISEVLLSLRAHEGKIWWRYYLKKNKLWNHSELFKGLKTHSVDHRGRVTVNALIQANLVHQSNILWPLLKRTGCILGNVLIPFTVKTKNNILICKYCVKPNPWGLKAGSDGNSFLCKAHLSH